MSWIADLFSALLSYAGQPVPQRVRIDFEGAGVTVVDDPANKRTVVTASGAATTGAIPSPIQMGPGSPPQWQEGSLPSITTTDDTTATILTAGPWVGGIPVPAGGAVEVRGKIKGKITSAAHTATYTNTFAAQWVRDGTSAPRLDFANMDTNESKINAQPFSATDKAPTPLTVSNATSNGGKVRLVVNDTTGMVAGNTVTVASVGGTTEINGLQVVTAVPDGTHLDFGLVSFVHMYTSGGTVTVHGSAGPVVVGNTIDVKVTGIKPPAWTQSETLNGFALRFSGSGNSYLYASGGTTSGSGTGPTGTGTGIMDGTATADFQSVGDFASVVWELAELKVITT